jgi:hypothetical protein
MPSHKSLKSVAHNVGHSFISLMNHTGLDYFLGALLKRVRTTKLTKLEIDLLNNIVAPKALLTVGITACIETNVKWFPEMVLASGSSIDFIKSAIVTIEFDLQVSRAYINDQKLIENPFVCETTIIDDRDKEYKSQHNGWWCPEC